MSRQIQLRRGTAAEHENFTGAPGELTVDTTNNTLRVHDGTTPGGHVVGTGTGNGGTGPTLPADADYVIESQLPTAENNYTWYRKYASGWVEQGGMATSSDTSTPRIVTLPVAMTDANYTLTMGISRSSTTSPGAICVYEAVSARTNQSFGCIGQWDSGASNGNTAYKYNWIAAGFAAQ